MCRYGSGNWKDILNNNPDVFIGRTPVGTWLLQWSFWGCQSRYWRVVCMMYCRWTWRISGGIWIRSAACKCSCCWLLAQYFCESRLLQQQPKRLWKPAVQPCSFCPQTMGIGLDWRGFRRILTGRGLNPPPLPLWTGLTSRSRAPCNGLLGWSS